MQIIGLFGIGYVGTVTAACTASPSRRIICVDSNPDKVDLLNRGMAPLVEPGLDDLIHRHVQEGRVSATTSLRTAVMQSDVSVVCVGTPGGRDGRLSLDAVIAVAEGIGEVLREKDGFHVIAIRSTVSPGTVLRVAERVEARSGKVLGRDFGVASNPEFLREGSAIADYRNPPFTIIGASCERTGAVVAALYDDLDAPLHQVAIGEAELLKYFCNAFHAAKVAFANEVGTLADSLGVDGRRLMDIFVQDTKLNTSAAYLKPGLPFGGSCLPKDTRAICSEARARGIDVPLLEAIEWSNLRHTERLVNRIRNFGKPRVGFVGLTFKTGTDDLRDSALVKVAADLIAHGHEVRIYDPEIVPDRLLGANRDFVISRLPEFDTMLTGSLNELLMFSQVLVLTKTLEGARPVRPGDGAVEQVLDLVPRPKGAMRVVDGVGIRA